MDESDDALYDLFWGRIYDLMCPICNNQSVPDLTPFCSKGCKNIDLVRWMKGSYVIPGESVDVEKLDDEGEE